MVQFAFEECTLKETAASKVLSNIYVMCKRIHEADDLEL